MLLIIIYEISNIFSTVADSTFVGFLLPGHMGAVTYRSKKKDGSILLPSFLARH